MNAVTIKQLTADIMAINRAAQSGNPSRLRLVWRGASPLSLAYLAKRNLDKPMAPERKPARQPAGIASLVSRWLSK